MIIDEISNEINASIKNSKPVVVEVFKDGDVYKGYSNIEAGEYIASSQQLKEEINIFVERKEKQIIISGLDSDKEKLNLFLIRDTASLLKAVKERLRSDKIGFNPKFIIGPPGTGKTIVIVNIINNAIKEGKRVLVTSPTNMAVENVFERLDLKLLGLKDEEILINIKTDNEYLKNFDSSIILKEKEQTINEIISTLNEAKEHFLKVIRDNQPLLSVQVEKSRSFSTLIFNLEQDLKKTILQEKNLKKESKSLKNRLNSIRSNIVFKALNLFSTKKEEEIEKLIEKIEKQIKDTASKKLLLEKEIQDIKTKYKSLDINKTKKIISQAETNLQKVTDEIDNQKKQLQKIRSDINAFSDAKLVGATLTSAALNKKLQNANFDMIIVDEASMALYPTIIGACQCLNNVPVNIDYSGEQNLTAAQNQAVKMSLQGKVIVVGDPRQLSPIAKTVEMKRSIFNVYGVDKIFENETVKDTVLLDINFRNHTQITDLASKMFYNGLLKSGKQNNGSSSIYIKMSKRPMSFNAGSYINKGNIALIVEQVKFALNRGRRSIGIITPYKKQAEEIEKAIVPLKELYSDADLQAGTIHKFQGKEKEIVIFDLTFAVPDNKKVSLPTAYVGKDINSETAKLLNVAMTRARDFFVVVGDITGIAYLDSDAIITSWCREIISLLK